MTRATLLQEMRKKAELCRQAAMHPTTGGHRADRLLRDLARQLEREAAILEEEQNHTDLGMACSGN
jgi:hypothetical protein